MNNFKQTYCFLVIFLTILGGAVRAQDAGNYNFIITGNVVDSDNQPILAGNVIVLSKKDSTMITGTAFFDSEFRILNLISNNYLLRVSSLGYKTRYVDIVPDSNEVILNQLQLDIDTLGGVLIKGYKPLFTAENGNFRVNVESSVLSTSGRLRDILKMSPDIIVDANHQIVVIGKGKPALYIDGILQHSDDQIDMLSSSDIKTVEIIKNPSSKYKGDASAVINVRTKRIDHNGILGSVGSTNIVGEHMMTIPNFQLSQKKSKLLFFIGYNGQLGDWGEEYVGNKGVSSQGSEVSLNNDLSYEITQKAHNGTLGLNYYVDSSSTVGFQYTGGVHDANFSTNNQINTTDSQSGNRVTSITSENESLNVKHFGNINYQKSFKNGSDMSAYAQYKSGYTDIDIDMVEEDLFNTDYIYNNSKSEIDYYSLNIEYLQPIDTTLNFEIGVQFSDWKAINENIYATLGAQGEILVDEELSYNNKSTEDIYAGYLQFTKRTNRLSVTLGSRIEHISLRGEDISTAKSYLKKDYLSLFPNVNLDYKLKKSTLGIYVSRKAVRPSFQALNPYVFYMDTLSVSSGNPDLLPEYRWIASTSLDMGNKGNISLEYTYSEDYIQYNSLDYENNVFVYSAFNLDNWYEYALDYKLSKTLFNSLNMFHNLELAYDVYKFTRGGQKLKNRDYRLYYYTSFAYDLPKIAAFDMIFYYHSNYADGVYSSKSFNNLSLGVTRKFLDNNLILRFVANDIFKANNIDVDASPAGLDYSQLTKSYTSYFQVSLIWNFKKNKPSQYNDASNNNPDLQRF